MNVLADGAYDSRDNFNYLDSKGIEAYVYGKGRLLKHFHGLE